MKTKTRNLSIEKVYRRRTRIDLNPIFQREKVWKLTAQQYLLDTIIKSWGIPKIYLAVKKDSRGEENFICIACYHNCLCIFMDSCVYCVQT